MKRPTRSEFAKARAALQRFLAENPAHELAPILAILLRATAPFTKEETIPVMVEHANTCGGWKTNSDDCEKAEVAISGKVSGPWNASIRAQWATLMHFFGDPE